MLLLCSEIANQRRFRIIPGCSAQQTQNQIIVWFKIIVVWVDKIIVVANQELATVRSA